MSVGEQPVPGPAGGDVALRNSGGLWAVALGVGLLCVYAQRVVDPDLPGYLAYGRYFVERGGPTARDVFSYTCPDCTWVYFEYLSHSSLWLAYSIGGPLGLIALKCALGALTLLFAGATLRMSGHRPAAWFPLYLFVTGTVPRFFLFRPQLVTFALFSFFTYTLFRYLEERRTRLWVLPLATALWANCHGGFVAGLGAIGLAILLCAARTVNQGGSGVRDVWRATRPLCVAGAACAAFSLLNPQGWRLWSYLLLELTHDTNRTLIAEWMPLSFVRDAWSAAAVVLLSCALGVSVFAASAAKATPGRIRPWQWGLSCVPLLLLSIQSARHVPLFVLWTAPVAAILFAGGQPAWKEFRGRWIWEAVNVLLIVPSALTILSCATDLRPRIGMRPDSFGRTAPYSAVSYFKVNRMEGNVYLPLWWGSYVTWSLYPGVRVSMDGRNVSLYPDSMVLENLRFHATTAFDLDAPLRYKTDFVVVPADAPVGSPLRTDLRWVLIFEDKDCLVFVNADRRHADVLSRFKSGRLLPPERIVPTVFR
jgi:hypothetical protein